ncbi:MULTISPECIES: fatty acid desaturase [unclassified Burkholderia]|uniref:fatty acid desaturase n=1 Tax=unclassified Burkholderia TaxID=2613784 RepID=UPI00158C6A56|nr:MULTISPECIES: fatty acid desaturase [unclassified Burkholderia]
MTSKYTFPSAPPARFDEFLKKSKALEGVRLTDAIPKSLYEPRAWRGVLGFVVSYAAYIGALVGIAYAPHWLFYVPLWLLAGLGGWGLHCIAHDCGHNSFSRSRWFNLAIGHLSLLPLLYPFHAWRHTHNLHHANTNNLELDTDWRPIPAPLYDRMSFLKRLEYAGTRKWLFWAGTVSYWKESGFRPGFYPKREMRRDVKHSIAFVLIASALYFPALIYFTGITGLFLYFVVPWLMIHAWFSATTLMHHTSDDIPFLPSQHWTPNASRLLVTTDYRYPKWLHFMTHNISVHTAHHVAPIVPFYNLPKAQAALKEAFPGMIREKDFTFGDLWHVIRHCHFYDTESGYYRSLSREAVPVGARTAAEGR